MGHWADTGITTRINVNSAECLTQHQSGATSLTNPWFASLVTANWDPCVSQQGAQTCRQWSGKMMTVHDIVLLHSFVVAESLPITLPFSCNRVSLPVDTQTVLLSTQNRQRPCNISALPAVLVWIHPELRQSIAVHRRKWLNVTV